MEVNGYLYAFCLLVSPPNLHGLIYRYLLLFVATTIARIRLAKKNGCNFWDPFYLIFNMDFSLEGLMKIIIKFWVHWKVVYFLSSWATVRFFLMEPNDQCCETILVSKAALPCWDIRNCFSLHEIYAVYLNSISVFFILWKFRPLLLPQRIL